MTQIRGSSNAKARRELGWTPAYGSWRAGFAAGLGGEEPGTGDPDGTPAGGKAA